MFRPANAISRWRMFRAALTSRSLPVQASRPDQALQSSPSPGAESQHRGGMPDSFGYPAEIALNDGGRHVASFPDFEWGATEGATFGEALAEAWGCATRTLSLHDARSTGPPRPVGPVRQQVLVVPLMHIALKTAFYETFRGTCLSRRGLARKLGVAEVEVWCMLNPDQATRAAVIDRALHRLGRRVMCHRVR